MNNFLSFATDQIISLIEEPKGSTAVTFNLRSLYLSAFRLLKFKCNLDGHQRLSTRVYNNLKQPFSIFLPWRNPWNNFQVSGKPCIKIIISTAHGTLAWSLSCRYNNPIIIVNALLSREWYFSVDLFILTNLLAYSFCVVPPPTKDINSNASQ
jgi:hypothetical protein